MLSKVSNRGDRAKLSIIAEDKALSRTMPRLSGTNQQLSMDSKCYISVT